VQTCQATKRLAKTVFSAQGRGIHFKAWGSAPGFVKEALPALKARFTSGTGSTLRAWLKRTFGANHFVREKVDKCAEFCSSQAGALRAVEQITNF